ncbi:MAG: Glu/Leu/Phe/Val dehydrogenase [Gammaproteobacteria bacterium]|jgi:leucine dehydrogenase
MTTFKSMNTNDHEQVIFCNDPDSGLKAIIAIHDTQLGPALGGCRMYPYTSEKDALFDVLRLSQGMTYKSAVSGLNFGGGKSVIIGDPTKLSSEQLFRTFGRFVDGLNGRYITAEDVGTDVSTMEWVRIETRHVVGIPTYLGGLGDPSPVTAHGTFVGIKASLKKQTGNDDLAGIKVAVQGAGHVGYYLCQELHEHGAKLFVADINKDALKKVADEFSATIVKPNEIYSQDVDVFAPCALGAILNDETIAQLKCSVVAGAANNPLLDEMQHADTLKQRGILYAPDYVINAGGLIDVASEFFEAGRKLAWDRTEGIYDTLLKVYTLAEKDNVSTAYASKKMAEDRIHGVKRCKNIFTRRSKRKTGD